MTKWHAHVARMTKHTNMVGGLFGGGNPALACSYTYVLNTGDINAWNCAHACLWSEPYATVEIKLVATKIFQHLGWGLRKSELCHGFERI